MTVNHMGQKEALATVVIEFLNFVDSPFPRPMPETIKEAHEALAMAGYEPRIKNARPVRIRRSKAAAA